MLKLCRTLHNWLGLILAIQITLGFLSGLVMAILPIEQVRGEHLRQTAAVQWQQAVVSPQQVLQQHSAHASLSLSQRLAWQNNHLSALPVYLVEEGNRLSRYSAVDGEPLESLSEQDIRQLALAQYSGDSEIVAATLLQQLPQEVQHLNAPVWQLQFNDSEHSRFYLDPATGAVTRVRTDSWRLFDFLWMLHIMDYEDREDFNHPLLIVFSATALFFTLTGALLLPWRRKRRSDL